MIQKLYRGKTSFATEKNKKKDGTDPVYWFIRSLLLTDGAVWRESQVTIHYSHPRDWLAAARFSRVILVETNSANRSPNVWESSSAVGKTAVTTWVAQADDKRWPKPSKTPVLWKIPSATMEKTDQSAMQTRRTHQKNRDAQQGPEITFHLFPRQISSKTERCWVFALPGSICKYCIDLSIVYLPFSFYLENILAHASLTSSDHPLVYSGTDGKASMSMSQTTSGSYSSQVFATYGSTVSLPKLQKHKFDPSETIFWGGQ